MNFRIAFSLASIIALSACAGTGADYRPIVDGDLTNYDNDLVECKELALQREYFNGDTKTDAAVGAGAGALVGLTENLEAGVAGAIIGATVGAVGDLYHTHKDRKKIVVNCMKGRGYNVVG